jgi:threonine/homoserine/homoserine lactone efflux protein
MINAAHLAVPPAPTFLFYGMLRSMSDLFPPWPLLSAFLLASLVLAISPGPGVLYIVTRSFVQGRRAGLVSVAGIAIGNLGNALAAAIGLAALFAVSALAFTVIKYAGALYLVYLGVQMLRATDNGAAQAKPVPASLRRIFRDGVVVSLLNPKTTVFFAAFLPQFMSPAEAPLPQSMALGALFVAIAAVTDSLYALLAAGSVAPALTQLRGTQTSSWLSLGRRTGGGLFIGLGVFTALTGQRK